MFARLRFSRPMIARFETLLPEPDSPTIAERLAARERERDVLTRLDDAVGRREANGQVTYVEQGAVESWVTRNELAGRGTRTGCRRRGS